MLAAIKKITIACIATSLSSFALSDGFDVGDARSMAMGGTGAASADPYVAQLFNPALLANQNQPYQFALLLPAASAYINDRKGLFSYIEEFAETDLQAIQNLELLELNTLLSALNGADPNDPNASDQDKAGFSANLLALTTGTGVVLAEVSQLLAAVQGSAASSQPDPAVTAAAQEVFAANDNLKAHNRAFESKLVTLETESQRIQAALASTRRGIIGLDQRGLTLGAQVAAGANLGFSTFKTGFTYHTKSAMEVNAIVDETDLDPLDLTTQEIENISVAANDASDAVSAWTISIENLTNALQNFDQARRDYAACTTLQTCESALTEVFNQASSIKVTAQQISDDSVEVNQKISGVTGYTTPGCENGAAAQKPADECPIINGIFNFAWFSQQLTNTDNISTALRVSGIVLTEASIAYAAEFDWFGGLALGFAPKLQQFGVIARDIKPQDAALITSDPISLLADQRSYFGMNVDFGVAKFWQTSDFSIVTAGLMASDLIPKQLPLIRGANGGSDEFVTLRPQVRLGVAYDWADFAMVSLDLDLTKNSALGIGEPSRFIGIGGELDLFNAAALRMGYRDNLADNLPGSISAGLGVTPFGIGVSVAGYIIPSANLTDAVATFGVSGQLSVKF